MSSSVKQSQSVQRKSSTSARAAPARAVSKRADPEPDNDEFRLVVSRYVSDHRTQAEAAVALRKLKLSGTRELGVVVRRPKGGWNG